MALIGEIVTKIRVDASQQKRALETSKRSFIKFGKVAQKSVDVLKKSVLGLTAAIAGVGVGLAKTAANMKILSDRSASLNIPVDQLQKFGYVLKSIGFESEKAVDVLKDINDKTGEFIALGTGQAAEVFEVLGIDKLQVQGKNAVEIINLMSKRMGELNIAAKEQTFLWEALANDLSLIAPKFKNGAKEMNAVTKNLESLGANLTKTDTQGVQAFNKSFGETKTLLNALSTKTFAILAPQLEKVLTVFNKWLKDSGAGKEIINGLSGSVGFFLESLRKLPDALSFFGNEIALIKNEHAAAFEIMTNDLKQYIKEASIAINIFKNDFDFLNPANIGGFLREKLTNTFETLGNFDPGSLSPIRFGEAANKPRPAPFKDPVADLLRGKGPLAANKQAGTAPQGKVELVVRTDTATTVEEVKKSRAIEQTIEMIIQKETAKLGR